MTAPHPFGIPTLGGTVTEFAPDGAARIHFKVAPGLHRVPDGVAIAALEHQLLMHVGNSWLACLLLGSGHGVIRPSAPGIGTPDKDMQALLSGIAIALNHHEAREGHWVVVLNLNEHEIVALWRDQDGDAHALLEFGEGPDKLAAWTDVELAAHAAQVLDVLAETHRGLDVKRAPTIRRALGEKAAGTRH